MNTVLDLYAKPTVMFDPKNKTHRRIAHDFLVNRSWGSSPVKFALPIGEDNTYTMVMRMLTEYYCEREFGTIPRPESEQAREQIRDRVPNVVWRSQKTIDNRS